MNWREKFTNILRDYEREIYVWGRGERRARGHLAHLGASGLLIGEDTQLPAIHHRPLRPLDNSYDSALLMLSICNWPHPLAFKVSPLAWEQACRGLLGDRLEGGLE